MVELGNRFFVIEIGGIAEAAQEVAGTDAFAVVGSQVFKLIYLDGGIPRKHLTQPFEALVERKEIFFGRIDPDSDDDFVEQRQSPFHQINMTDGDRVKRAWKDGDFHSVWLKQGRSWGFLHTTPSNGAICASFIFY